MNTSEIHPATTTPPRRTTSRRSRRQAALMFAWTCFLILVFVPRFVLSPIEGLSSAFRLDILLSFVFFFLAHRAINRGRPKKTQGIGLKMAMMALTAIYLLNSASIVVALGQIVLYWTLYQSYELGLMSASNSPEWRTRLRLFQLLLLCNSLLHLAYYATGLDPVTQTFSNSNEVEENYVVAGLYGTASMPFQFALFACGLFFLTPEKNGRSDRALRILIVLAALATGDSRIAAGAFVLAVFGWQAALVVPLIVVLGSSLPASEKMLSVLSLESNQVASDPSLLMRLDNIGNYQDWVTPNTLLFGAGAQGFLEFSKQYGYPGPLDMLYVRVLSEVGLVGLVILTIMSLRRLNTPLWFHAKAQSRRMLLSWLVFLFLYSLFNEGIVACRSGHLVFFVTGVLVGRLRSEK